MYIYYWQIYTYLRWIVYVRMCVCVYVSVCIKTAVYIKVYCEKHNENSVFSQCLDPKSSKSLVTFSSNT